MSHFGDLLAGKPSKIGKEEPAVVEAPAPVVEEETVPVVEEAPASVDFSTMSKDELEDYGRTVGIELDRRHNKKKLIKELEDHLQNSL